MTLAVAAIAIWLLLLGYAWSQAPGGPRERVRAMRWLLLGSAITAAMLAVFAVVPWVGDLVVPVYFMAFGAYAARLPADKATVGGVNLRRNGPISFVVGLMWLIVSVARLVQPGS